MTPEGQHERGSGSAHAKISQPPNAPQESSDTTSISSNTDHSGPSVPSDAAPHAIWQRIVLFSPFFHAPILARPVPWRIVALARRKKAAVLTGHQSFE